MQERFPQRAGETAADYRARVEEYMRGVDFSRPVEQVRLKPGDRVDIWVRDGGRPGSYGTTPDTSEGLGVRTDRSTGLPAGRHLEQYVVEKEMTVLQSTAADYPVGLQPGVGGFGGGTQYLLPSDFLSGATRIP